MTRMYPPIRLGYFLAVLLFVVAFLVPYIAMAAEEMIVKHPTAALIPWGLYISELAGIVSTVLLPILVWVTMFAIRRVAPWVELVLTQARVESMVTNCMNWGLNAVQGAAKGKTLSVDLGSKVIAEAANRMLTSNTPQKVIDSVGGAKGLAERVYRNLNLEEDATPERVINPAIASYPDPARN